MFEINFPIVEKEIFPSLLYFTSSMFLPIKASKIVSTNYAGIDLIRNKNKKLKVLEINSIPAWRALQKVTKKNIAYILAKAFISKINK